MMKLARPVREPIIAISVVFTVVLSLLVGVSLLWNIENLYQGKRDLAIAEAKANWNKDQAFRGWATRHGGLYVKPDKRTPPNPYLAHLPHRDVVTRDGVNLTLMNPAYMMSQMTKEYEKTYGVKGSITGKILLNPANAPDEWELKVLNEFDQGIKEVVEEQLINSESYIRLMRPMVMKQGCVQCHGHLGFKVGDIRGGVSVSISLKPYMEAANNTVRSMKTTHILVWCLGMLGLSVYIWTARRREHFRLQLQTNISNQNIILSEARDQAENANRAKSEFLSRMSHELRTPLNAILGFGQLLKIDADEFNKTQQDNVDEILEAGDHLLHLINDVLDLAKIESGKLDLCMEKVNVNVAMKQSIALIQPLANSQHIELIDNVSDKGYTVLADMIRFKQVLVNLLSNAVKYNRESGKIIIDSEHLDEHRLRIRITDHGEGLSEEEMSKLFTPFERLDNKNNVEGVGIGLVITKYMIELMNGNIGVESIKGQGSTFWIDIKLSH